VTRVNAEEELSSDVPSKDRWAQLLQLTAALAR